MKSSQGLVKCVIGCWVCPKTTSVYTKEKMSWWPWSARSPKDIFEGLHYPLTWSNGFCNGKCTGGALVEKGKDPWQSNVVLIIFINEFIFLWREDEDERTQANDQTWLFLFFYFLFFFKIAFLDIYQQYQHIYFLGAWTFLLVHIGFTPSEGPKGFVN